MKKNRTALRAVAAGTLVMLALFGAACGVDPTPDPAPTSASPAVVTVTATAPPSTATLTPAVTEVATEVSTEVSTETTTVSDPFASVVRTVQSVHDGDTFTLTGGEKVRVLGIDTPEVPPQPAGCYGEQAAGEARDLLTGETVTLTIDPAQGDGPDHVDPYGRLLRYVSLPSGDDFAATMLAGGYARTYPQYPVERSAQYASIQAEAQTAGRGLWAPVDAGGCPND